MTSLARCLASGKVIYWSEKTATKAITLAITRGELQQLRHYQCPACGRWHLSRKDRSVAA